MLYQMRLTNGAIDPISSGTFVRADGSFAWPNERRFSNDAGSFLGSKTTKANYPIGWRVALPKEQLEFTVRAGPAGSGAGA